MIRFVPALVLLTSTTALADHGIFNATASSASANTVVQFSTARALRGQCQPGQYSMSYLQIEFALLEQLSVTAGALGHALARGARSEAGLGDSTAGLKYQSPSVPTGLAPVSV